MSNGESYFCNAELALAAYSDLWSGMDQGQYVAALQQNGKGMSLAQAQKFAKTWRVMDQHTDSLSGLSVTVFAPTSDLNARYLAIRGTEPAATDLTADGLLALGLPATLNPQYVALKARLDQWLADPAVLQGKTFSVAGHSLGGYLAAAVKQQYGSAVTDAYLYNAPGVLGPIGNILSLFGLNGVPTANTWNLRDSEDLPVIACLDSAIGTQLDVLTESSFNPHSIVLLTDASKVSPGSTRGDDAWNLAA